MHHQIVRIENDAACVYQKYVDMVYRISKIMLKHTADAEDATQTVFTKYMGSNVSFKDEGHLKAWLITVTKNECYDLFRRRRRRNEENGTLAEIENLPYELEYQEHAVWEKVSALKEKYKLPIYLYYYEGYKTEEIAKILNTNHATIRTRLKTARKKLKLVITEGEDDEQNRFESLL